MKKLQLAYAPRSAPIIIAHDGGRAVRHAMSPTVVIMEIDDEEAALWDAEMARRSR